MGRWKPDEVQRLYSAVMDDSNWQSIAAYVGTRDKSQCQAKWKQMMCQKKGMR